MKEHFKEQELFETGDVHAFYRQIEDDIKRSTLNWRIYELVQKGVIKRVGRGKFQLGSEEHFAPGLPEELTKVYNRLHRSFPYLEACIWNTSVLNEFTVHQPGRFFNLIEVEKEATESVFHQLQESGTPVFLQPSNHQFEHYVVEKREAFIVQSLISEAPLQVVKGVPTVTLEKILVDLLTNNPVFNVFKGAELKTIFSNALEKYTLNENRVLRYANRRGKKKELLNIITSISNLKLSAKLKNIADL